MPECSEAERNDIYGAIPHRPPFLFVDRILSLDETSISTERIIRTDEDFFQGHYPGRPIMPGVLLCECVFQAGALFLSKTLDLGEAAKSSSPAITRIQNVKFKAPVRPGDTLHITATLKEKMAQVFFMKGFITRDQKKVVTLEFACTLLEGEL